jgi:predicted ribosomally synthesized peptide with nif11-like leader
MTDNLKALIEKVSTDEELKKKVDALKELKDEKEIIAATIKIAGEYGIVITEDDFVPKDGEVDDNELNSVAGGSYCHKISYLNLIGYFCPQFGTGNA